MPAAAAPKDSDYRKRFAEAMDDDFNTPVAMSVLFDLAREVNTLKDTKPAEAPALAALLKELGGLLGILQSDPEAYLQAGADNRMACRRKKSRSSSPRARPRGRQRLEGSGSLAEGSWMQRG